jgi:hypothetical protein
MVNKVWLENINVIKKIINNTINKFKLHTSFYYECQNIFYMNFEKYYEDDKQYLNFFRKCVKNKALSEYNKYLRKNRISIYEIDGEQFDIFEVIEDNKNVNPHDELFLKEINDYMENNLDELALFVYKSRQENYSNKHIAMILKDSVEDFETYNISTIEQIIREKLVDIADNFKVLLGFSEKTYNKILKSSGIEVTYME